MYEVMGLQLYTLSRQLPYKPPKLPGLHIEYIHGYSGYLVRPCLKLNMKNKGGMWFKSRAFD